MRSVVGMILSKSNLVTVEVSWEKVTKLPLQLQF